MRIADVCYNKYSGAVCKWSTGECNSYVQPLGISDAEGWPPIDSRRYFYRAPLYSRSS